MAPHSSTLAWKIPWTEEPGRLQSMGLSESDMTEWLHFHFSLSCIGEGNSNPLQCSCLENPRDSGAWWAAVYGVARSRTGLKRLSSSSSSIDLFMLLWFFFLICAFQLAVSIRWFPLFNLPDHLCVLVHYLVVYHYFECFLSQKLNYLFFIKL